MIAQRIGWPYSERLSKKLLARIRATRIRLAPPRGAESMGMAERDNGYLETSFLPRWECASPADSTANSTTGWVKPTGVVCDDDDRVIFCFVRR